MEKRKYKLETAGCTDASAAIEAIHLCLQSVIESSKAFNSGELECSPSHPNYRKMIETLDRLGVAVFDYELVQLPEVNLDKEPQSYT